MIHSFRKFVALEVIACFFIGVGCEYNQNNASRPASHKGFVLSKTNAEFQIAISSDRPWKDRIISALKLNHQDRLELQELLLSRLPGNYTSEALDDLSVLAEIGDEHAVNNIEQIMALDRKNDIRVPGKINAARHDAIKTIQERQ